MPLLPSTQPLPLLRLLLPTLWELARGQAQPLARVGARLRPLMPAAPVFLDVERIPTHELFLVVFNHYETARVAAWWAAVLIAEQIALARAQPPRDLHLIMTREWAYADWFGRSVKQPVTRWLFDRVSRVYGTVLVPPVLDGNPTRGQGASGVRRALRLVHNANPQIVGIAPEGRTTPGGVLSEPPPGAGLVLWMLAGNTLPLLPVGIYEEAGTLVIRFGSPFTLATPERANKTGRDRAIAAQVMRTLAVLLPAELWGAYKSPA